MKDQLITFPTAKLAKEKGFNIPCIGWYYSKNPTQQYLEHCTIPINTNKLEVHNCSAPTQSLLQRWLIEKHNIYVAVNCNASGWYWELVKTNGTGIKSFIMLNSESGYHTLYEEALEVGLQEALKLIK